jgi:thiamine pyrophosphate-dependent acetolactate synthase large subunit-like protein
MLMNLGSLVTITNAAPPNFVLMVVQNSCYEITGGQPLPGLGKFNFTQLARAAGFPSVYEFEELDAFKNGVSAVLQTTGPVFVTLKVRSNPIPQAPRANMMEVIRRVRSALAVPEAKPVAG